MNILGIVSSFLILILLIAPAHGEELNGKDNSSPIGFEFGTSRKDAIKIIESRGKKILDKTTDSKKIRTIVMDGAIVELPLNSDSFQTSLEFFDDKLMASSLIFRSADSSEYQELETELSEFLTDMYGEPGEKEDVLGLKAWTWHVPDLKVVLSTNPKNYTAKVQYIHEPLNQSRVKKEILERQRGKVSEPAKEMFLDGNYSVPSQYKQ